MLTTGLQQVTDGFVQDDLEHPKGRQPKVQVALRPKLASALRYIAKKERRQLSDLFREMLVLWLRVRRPSKYSELKGTVDDEK